MVNSFDPNRPDFTPYGLTCVEWTPAPMERPNHHNEIELNMVAKGSLTYDFGTTQITTRSGELAVFWASIPHQTIECEDDTNYFVATIPYSWFLQFKLPTAFTEAIQRGFFLKEPIAQRITEECSRFSTWQEDLEEGTEEGREIVLIEVQARLMRMAKRIADTLPHEPRPKNAHFHKARLRHLDHVEQMACYIAQNYLNPITANQIGKATNLHPNYAMSLFKRFFGMSIVDYITFNRITHAQRLLLTTDLKVPDIAHASGFLSISRFNEAFRSLSGTSPRNYRKERSY
ncbi:helix-turn-helix domain-containing protein [Pelagicoccus albus]|uniref:Helix-turn-helix domain-containing protein n=1 Tax=Pelagicoccus albus TaxID=415222 RepID=A0A7X1EAA7_9BACT|nr:helix-turn-helix domain-containing protein [Pelagicoccus albus]MBC2608088.1 helix-turn-helix domain-containing protein [Pelagicoccus albus]